MPVVCLRGGCRYFGDLLRGRFLLRTGSYPYVINLSLLSVWKLPKGSFFFAEYRTHQNTLFCLMKISFSIRMREDSGV